MRPWFYLPLATLTVLLGVMPASADVTFGSLLAELSDLERLAQWPEPGFRTVQFSSYDRRSSTSDAPGWFSNADGFGREPIPAFQETLRPPKPDQPGLYLIADVKGPGAIVRGWSAGMDGILRVYLDPAAEPGGVAASGLVWEGKAYDFLARRSAQYFRKAGLDLDAADAFVQQDADYLPIPFSKGLRVTWEGNLNDLHFYHLQVRLYPAPTTVRTFDPVKDLKESSTALRAAVDALTRPSAKSGDTTALQATIGAGTNWTWTSEGAGPGAIRELKLRLQADALDTALRGCLLRITFDGSQRPHVEAPVGDFFASGPGINPFESLPFGMEPDGTLTCRWVMPYAKAARIELVNFTGSPVRLEGSVRLSSWHWNERSLYFTAKWRADHDLLAGAPIVDLPYSVTIGKGIFAGCAAMIMNPTGVPTAGGNWWGEGDEKFLVDGEQAPSTFGTGSEDYFNYSWSRPDLFDHPFCGQPLDSGPDTAGYVSNHRFQIGDAIPFERSFAGYLELWVHRRTEHLSYARIAYLYLRPGAVDDHRGLMPSDLKIPALPKRQLVAYGGAAGARFYLPNELKPESTGGKWSLEPFPLATQLQVLQWHAEKGGQLNLSFEVEKSGRVGIRLVAAHTPRGAVIRVLLDGKPLMLENNLPEISLKTAHATRILNVSLKPAELASGTHRLTLECVEPGIVGLDYLWIK